MKGVKCTTYQKLFITLALLFVPLFGLFAGSNVSATSVSTSSADVSFWSTSASGQVTATVSLPWDANIGGSASDLQQFYLNSIAMTYPITTTSSDTSIYGRLVMRFTPWYNSNEEAFFCDKRLNDYTNSVDAVATLCSGTITYNYSDGTTYSVSAPLYFNYVLPSGNLNAYVDYTQALPNTALSSITLTLSKTGSYDIYSVPSGYGLILSTLSGNASYYIGGSGVDFGPIINQNNTIINQNQQQIDQDNQDREDLQNQSDGSQDSAESAADDLNNAKTGLFSVIANFIDIVIHPPASNCVIDADMGNMDLGDIDLCQLSLPPAFAVIGTLLIIGFLIPLGYSVISTILSLLKGATQD